MEKSFYTRQALRVFTEDLPRALLDAGFEIAEEPYIDYALCGFRATYIRRYLLHQQLSAHDEILTTIIHTVGIPFGQNGHKMVIMSAPRNLKNEPVAETLKLRLHFAEDGTPRVICNDEQKAQTQQAQKANGNSNQQATEKFATSDLNVEQESTLICSGTTLEEQFVRHQHECAISIMRQRNPFDKRSYFSDKGQNQFLHDLAKYVSHIIEVISPGLIELPMDVKLEILKQLSVDSIIKMSQVNNEFRNLIFKHGESLWRHLCLRDFSIRFINRMVHKSWMELYKDTYLLHQLEICRKERALPGLPERLALPPVPYRLQIEWLPEVLELPFYPVNEILALPDNPILALEFHPLRRASSLDSLS